MPPRPPTRALGRRNPPPSPPRVLPATATAHRDRPESWRVSSGLPLHGRFDIRAAPAPAASSLSCRDPSTPSSTLTPSVAADVSTVHVGEHKHRRRPTTSWQRRKLLNARHLTGGTPHAGPHATPGARVKAATYLVVEGERDGRRPFGPAAEHGAGVAAVGHDEAAADEDGHDGGGADDAVGADSGAGDRERAAAGRARDAAARARQRRHRVHAPEAAHQRGTPCALLLRRL